MERLWLRGGRFTSSHRFLALSQYLFISMGGLRETEVFNLWPLQTGSDWHRAHSSALWLSSSGNTCHQECVCVRACMCVWLCVRVCVFSWLRLFCCNVRYWAARSLVSVWGPVLKLCMWLCVRECVLWLCTNVYVIHHYPCQCVCLTWAHLSPQPRGTGASSQGGCEGVKYAGALHMWCECVSFVCPCALVCV